MSTVPAKPRLGQQSQPATPRRPGASVYRSGGADPWRRTSTPALLLAVGVHLQRQWCCAECAIPSTASEIAAGVRVTMTPIQMHYRTVAVQSAVKRAVTAGYADGKLQKGAISVLQAACGLRMAIVPWRILGFCAEGRSFPRPRASRRGPRALGGAARWQSCPRQRFREPIRFERRLGEALS